MAISDEIFILFSYFFDTVHLENALCYKFFPIYKHLKSAKCVQAKHFDISFTHYENSGQRNIEGANKLENKY